MRNIPNLCNTEMAKLRHDYWTAKWCKKTGGEEKKHANCKNN